MELMLTYKVQEVGFLWGCKGVQIQLSSFSANHINIAVLEKEGMPT